MKIRFAVSLSLARRAPLISIIRLHQSPTKPSDRRIFVSCMQRAIPSTRSPPQKTMPPSLEPTLARTHHSHPFILEPYSSSAHKEGIDEICKNVYGGTDYLPSLVDKWTKEGDVALVARGPLQPTCSSTTASPTDDVVLAVICARRHGNSYWVYGLRTHEGTRGRGLARALLSALQDQLQLQPSRPQLLSATILRNGPMRKVFSNLGWEESRRLFVWPPWAVTGDLDKANGGSRLDSSHATLTSLYPPASALLSAPTLCKGATWRTAQTVEEVASAMERVLGIPEGQGDDAALYFPFEYKAYVVRSEVLQRMVSDGHVRIMDGPSGPQAIYTTAISEEMRGRLCVGIVADSQLAAASVLQAEILPRFPRPVCFLYLRDKSGELAGVVGRTPEDLGQEQLGEGLGAVDEFLLCTLPKSPTS